MARRQVALITLLAGLAIAGCSSGLTSSAAPTTTAGPAATEIPSELPAGSDNLVLSLASGDWRRHAVAPPLSFAEPFETGCRNAEAGIGELPLVVVDLRGRGIVTLAFANQASGYVCSSTLETAASPEAVDPFQVPSGGVDGIDVVDYRSIGSGDDLRTVLIGRWGPMASPPTTFGGPRPTDVIAGFDDETFVWGALGTGWYAMWWPGRVPMAGVSTVNSHHEVLASADAPLP